MAVQSDLSDYGGTNYEQAERRRRLRDRLDRMCSRDLRELAFLEDWPITEEHCLRRVAYDQAVRARWDDVVDRPFVENATVAQLRRATAVCSRMKHDGPAYVRHVNDCSLLRRGHASPDEVSCCAYWVAMIDRRRSAP
jgi:hypothetical protein